MHRLSGCSKGHTHTHTYGESCHRVKAHRTGGLDFLWRGVKTGSDTGIEQNYTSTPAICTHLGWQEGCLKSPRRPIISYATK